MTTEDEPLRPEDLELRDPDPIWDFDRVVWPSVSLAEAGAQSHLSVATIRRRLKAEQIPGAVRNADRSWSIPVKSLWTTGIWAHGTWPAEPHDRYDHP